MEDKDWLERNNIRKLARFVEHSTIAIIHWIRRAINKSVIFSTSESNFESICKTFHFTSPTRFAEQIIHQFENGSCIVRDSKVSCGKMLITHRATCIPIGSHFPSFLIEWVGILMKTSFVRCISSYKIDVLFHFYYVEGGKTRNNRMELLWWDCGLLWTSEDVELELWSWNSWCRRSITRIPFQRSVFCSKTKLKSDKRSGTTSAGLFLATKNRRKHFRPF